MEKTLELAPPSAFFRALLGACEVPGEALQKPLCWEVPRLWHPTLRPHLLKTMPPAPARHDVFVRLPFFVQDAVLFPVLLAALLG